MKPIAVWSVAVVAAVLVATAAAAPPPVHATSWLVENGATLGLLYANELNRHFQPDSEPQRALRQQT